MSRHDSKSHRFEFVRGYLAPAACLLAWLGLCAVGWMNLGNSAAERLSTKQSPASSSRADERVVTEQSTDNPERAATQADTATKPDAPISASPGKQPDTPGTGDDESQEVQTDVATDSTDSPSAQTSEPSTQPTDEPNQPSADAQSTNPTASPHVSRAQLTRGLENKEPVDRVTRVFHSKGKGLRRLYYFTDLKNLRGEKVEHNWWHEGRLIATVASRVGSNSWRMHSSKKLIPSMAGPWRVVLNDGQGETLSVAKFVYKVP